MQTLVIPIGERLQDRAAHVGIAEKSDVLSKYAS
jgi:hypothetical protein